MKVKQQLQEQRNRLIRQVGLFAASHPELSFARVGERYGVSPQWASRAARAIGTPARRRGRKQQRYQQHSKQER
jgi:tRNA(His) 5'-end guanylyltransferase